MSIEKYGFKSSDMAEHKNGIIARISAVYRDIFEIVCDLGTGFARLKTGEYRWGNENIPTTGDFILVDWQENGVSRIVKTLPRKTYISRLDPSSSGHGEQGIAANFDYAFIIQSLDQNFNLRRLERYLTIAWQSGAIPAIILTKADGIEDYTTHQLAVEKLAIGVSVFAVSAKTGYGMDRLTKFLKPGKTVVFLGSSGVGKSTLVNSLAGEEVMTTNSTRVKDGRGRHTTSHRQLILLKSGVIVIDTPGMRELGMWNVSEGLGQSFFDVEKFFGQCKFSDCHHQSEPGCAIKEAIQRGELLPERWESYRKLCAEARFTSDKAGYLREKEQWHKAITKMQKIKKAPDYRMEPCTESFSCKVCGTWIAPEEAGSQHRNHCPHCLTSIHLDNHPGDRASLCKGIMDPIAVWVRKNGEWAIIHRCRSCGTIRSNRIAADDNTVLLLSIAMKPLTLPFRHMEKEFFTENNIKDAHVIDTSCNTTFTCKVCGAVVPNEEQRNHCPHCLTSIHVDKQPGDKQSLCKEIMDPIAVWVQENGDIDLIHRCRACATIRANRIAADDNTTLLLSIAMKPLAAPPFPLWQMSKAFITW